MILTEIYYRVVLKTHKFRTLTLDFLDQKNISCDTIQLEFGLCIYVIYDVQLIIATGSCENFPSLSSGIRLPSFDNISQFFLLRNQCAKWTKLICNTSCMVIFQIKSGDNFVQPRWFSWLLVGWNLEIFLIILSFHSYALTKPDCCDYRLYSSQYTTQTHHA